MSTPASVRIPPYEVRVAKITAKLTDTELQHELTTGTCHYAGFELHAEYMKALQNEFDKRAEHIVMCDDELHGSPVYQHPN